MNILVIGLGSIGQRHIRNLRKLYGDKINLYAFRERNNSVFPDEKGKLRNGNIEAVYNIRTYFDIDKCFIENKIDAVIVSTVTAKHVLFTKIALQHEAAVFIEKPLADKMDGVQEIFQLAEKKNLPALMGFQMRHHPCIKALKSLLDNDAIGQVFSADFLIGEKVDKMHQYEDYRKTYIVSKNLGGGVVLNQQIHEIDLMLYLFGKPDRIFSFTGKLKNVDSDVEDYADSIYIFNRTKNMTVTMHSDFATYPPQRKIRIRAEEGFAEVDLLNATMIFREKGKDVQTIVFDKFQRNDMFLEEMEEFIQIIQNDSHSSVTLAEGAVSLEVALTTLQKANELKGANNL